MRGSELIIAESWLSDGQQNQKQPPAMPLQREFIDASIAEKHRIEIEKEEQRQRELEQEKKARELAELATQQQKKATKNAQIGIAVSSIIALIATSFFLLIVRESKLKDKLLSLIYLLKQWLQKADLLVILQKH